MRVGEPFLIMENKEEINKEKKKIRDKQYQQSDKWKEYAKQYRNRPEAILARKAYRKTEKARLAEIERRKSDKYKECVKLFHQRPEVIELKKAYQQSEEGREYRRRYNKRPEVIEKRNAQERKDYVKRWKNKEQSKILTKKWLESYKKTNKYKSVRTAQSAKRRAVKKLATIIDSKAISKWFKEWKIKSHVICHWCKNNFSPKDCEADHVMPISKGGTHSLCNLVIACRPCNRKKSAKLPSEWVVEILLKPLINKEK